MNKPIIEIKNLGKRYTIQHQRSTYTALRDVIALAFSKPLIFLKSKINRSEKKTEDFWALKNIDLSVQAGEVIGIIGHNGAGKSTLLKILSQITPPTTGEVIIRGRVGSLLEVGTGFHPELTGRENTFLNGAILGMTKKEMEKKFNEIVDFAGIEKFLDTPVKYYSSGMYVRLAFSVAAHLDPDILIVDEVLAVGDAEFQKKCLGKMEEVTKKEGRTIFFVSHNLSAIQSLCKKCLLLDKGELLLFDETEKVVEKYLTMKTSLSQTDIGDRKDRKGDGRLRITKALLKNDKGEDVSFFRSGDNIQLWFEYELLDKSIKEINFALGIDTYLNQTRIAHIFNKIVDQKVPLTDKYIKIGIKNLPLNSGLYQFTIYADDNGRILDWIQSAATFNVEFGDFYNTGQIQAQNQGHLLLDYNFINNHHA